MTNRREDGSEGWTASSVRLARARVALRTLFGLTDRGAWAAPGVLGCAYPRTDRALAALSASGIRLLVNLHGRPHDPARLRRHGLREVHLPVADFSAPSPEQIERGVGGDPRGPGGGRGGGGPLRGRAGTPGH